MYVVWVAASVRVRFLYDYCSAADLNLSDGYPSTTIIHKFLNPMQPMQRLPHSPSVLWKL